MMTDYKVFFLDYVQDESSYSKAFQSRNCFYVIRSEIYSSVVHLADIL